ncbi:MAG: PBECR4 domain-containing protein [Clostridiales bacterium]|nr:PBECR4 domain-containing protein [Clostridiales bacterium]
METKYYNNDTAIPVIVEAAGLYKRNLLNKSILFITKQNNDLVSYKVDFKAFNFLHFFGIKTELSAEEFFKRASKSRLSPKDFIIKNKKYTTYKIDIVLEAVSVNLNAKTIGDFGSQGIKIEADLGVGNVAYTMTLRRFKQGANNCYPVGILKSDVRSEVYPHSPVLAVLSKNIKDKKYSICTYKSKNINFEKIHIPKELSSVITEELLQELKPNIKPENQD